MDGDVPVPLEGAQAAAAEAGRGGSDAVPVPLEGAQAGAAEAGRGGSEKSEPDGSSSDSQSES